MQNSIDEGLIQRNYELTRQAIHLPQLIEVCEELLLTLAGSRNEMVLNVLEAKLSSALNNMHPSAGFSKLRKPKPPTPTQSEMIEW